MTLSIALAVLMMRGSAKVAIVLDCEITQLYTPHITAQGCLFSAELKSRSAVLHDW